MSAVLLELILGEQDVQKLLICLLMRSLHPLFQFVDVKVVLLGLEGRLEAHIEDPIMLIAASADEIDGFAGLEDFVGQVIR
mmetsp:Transcript_42520/g.56110  ORF Transcript_42520/g.56110 Transcript_42520/m.56110 type:complete len:81 (-) Transcript_42520:1328-1570(-)